METNNSRAPVETRPPSAGLIGPEPPAIAQLPPRPLLARVDSRSTFPSQPQQQPQKPLQQQPQQQPQKPLHQQPQQQQPQQQQQLPYQQPQPQPLRPGVPPQSQQRPQFQPGGPVTSPPQFAARPGTPAPRGPISSGPPGTQQIRPQPPPRPFGPQSFAPQQGPRPLQSPTSGQPPQRVPPPNNLQFGPRQQPQFGTAITPDGTRPQLVPQLNGAPRNSVPPGAGPVAGLPRQPLQVQPSQGSLRGVEPSNLYQNKSVNLDNQTYSNGGHNANKPENASELSGMAKARSYSIAAAPGAPSPLKMEDDRRKSVSAIGGKIDEYASRSPGLGFIQEGKVDSKDNIRGSKESVRSNTSNEGEKVIPERPDSRLSGFKVTDSFIENLPTSTPKKRFDDNDDVVLHNVAPVKNAKDLPQNQNKTQLLDRSPSLTRSDDSPELKQNTGQDPALSNTSPSVTQEMQRPKTPKTEIKQEIKDAHIVLNQNKPPPKPFQESTPMPVVRKPNELNTFVTSESKKSTPRKTASAPKSRPKDGDNDSGVDESTQGNDLNGSPGSPNKKVPSKLPTKEKSSNNIMPSLSRSSSKSATAKTPENPSPAEKKKVPMNKVQVGNAPSPNIKAVKSKIGSLDNTTYKPGGGKVKIENRKLEFGNVTPRIAAKNDAYVPTGGTKKITTTKLEWNAKSKVGSLQNTAYKPGGGDKKIETVKLDFKEKAKPKVASTVNITHKPGGGAVKSTVTKNGSRAIENQKLEIKAQSKIGSLDNVKHKPGGGDIKIFDDKDYMKQMSGQSPVPGSHNHSRQESPTPPAAQPVKSDENLNQQQC